MKLRCARLLAAVAVVGFLASLPSPLCGAGGIERVFKRDGSSIAGEIIGFRDGAYLVRAGDEVIQVAAADVVTILEEEGAPPGEESAPPVAATSLQDLLDALALRSVPDVPPRSVELYRDALAGVIRGEWDYALEGTERLAAQEPEWLDPRLLRALVLAETGRLQTALKVADELEENFGEEPLARRLAAEVYRRAGFPHRYASALEAAYRAEMSGPRLEHDLAALWWSVDAEEAARHWALYLDEDPLLERPWSDEGSLLRRIRVALKRGEWHGAAASLEEAARSFPWLGGQLEALKVEVVEKRLASAEVRGHLVEAILSFEALRRLDPGRALEWEVRLDAMRGALHRDALRLHDLAALRAWCAENAPLSRSPRAAEAGPLAARFQELALVALGRGDAEGARAAFRDAERLSPGYRAPHLASLLGPAIERAREGFLLRRTDEALAVLQVIHDAFPEQDPLLRRELAAFIEERGSSPLLGPERAVVRERLLEILSGSSPQTPQTPLERPSQGAVAEGPGGEEGAVTARRDPGPGATAAVEESAESPAELLERYFPHAPGTRWVYRLDDGRTEEREVTAVRRLANGAQQIIFSVRAERPATSFEMVATIRGDELILGGAEAPPGEIALKLPLLDGATWEWQKGPFRYQRRIERQRQGAILAIGTHDDVLVVHGDNLLMPRGGDTPYRSAKRTTLVAGVGIARIECDNPRLNREVMEFHPPTPARAARGSR
ncbi:MAG: hypothetical protein ACE5GW_09240 [Planctomycetota bacterium]